MERFERDSHALARSDAETAVPRTGRFYRHIHRLRPWYHDFTSLGVRTVFPDIRLSRLKAILLGRGLSSFRDPEQNARLLNQRSKEPIILEYSRRSLQSLRHPRPVCLDLFSSDGYYAFHLKRLHRDARVLGVDRNGDDITRAVAMAAVLSSDDDVRFEQADVRAFCDGRARDGARFDVVLCTGGLYHLDDPRRFLDRLRCLVAHALVVQSVVTLETESADYFASPAPGWAHGSRFTHAALRGWLVTCGFRVESETRNELAGNSRLCDRGSSYFLCRIA